LFGGLNSISWNINRQNTDLRLYEFGNCYIIGKSGKSLSEVGNYSERRVLDLFITGNNGQQTWNNKSGGTDFFNIKSAVEMVLSRLGIRPENIVSDESIKKYFTESLTYTINNTIIAEAGRIAKNYLNKFDIVQEVFYAHIEWDLLLKQIRNHTISYKELPKYPAVRRDLALLLDKGVKFRQVRETAFRTEKNILQDVGLFDVYESETLGKNKKSYAVSFILQDNLKTLTDKYIDKVMHNLIKAFEIELNAHIR
jgi:phenylalanyl-tRNA synthetase beta chain